MIILKWISAILAVFTLQILVTDALAGYPGTFYQIMMLLNKDRKNPRTAPSPNKLWAILDPPAALGSLGGSPLNTNRILRSVGTFRDHDWTRQLSNAPVSLKLKSIVKQSGGLGSPSVVESESASVVELGSESVGTSGSATIRDSGSGSASVSESGSASASDSGSASGSGSASVSDSGSASVSDSGSASVSGSGSASESGSPSVGETSIEEESPETEALVCGGDFEITIDPHNLAFPDGRIFHKILETPGWDEGEYPEDIECTWNLNVGTDCMMGMLFFIVKEGYIRETRACSEDYLKVTNNGGPDARYCGQMVSGSNSVSGTDIWTVETEVPRSLQLTFKSDFRQGDIDDGEPRGFQMEVSSYCWAFSQDLLSRTTTPAAPIEAPGDASVDSAEGALGATVGETSGSISSEASGATGGETPSSSSSGSSGATERETPRSSPSGSSGETQGATSGINSTPAGDAAVVTADLKERASPVSLLGDDSPVVGGSGALILGEPLPAAGSVGIIAAAALDPTAIMGESKDPKPSTLVPIRPLKRRSIINSQEFIVPIARYLLEAGNRPLA